MFDKLIALVALVLFIASLAILGWWVEDISIKVVLGITIAMAGYDFWLEAFSPKSK